MADNLILVCAAGFALSLLCNAALVVWTLIRKEGASQAECASASLQGQVDAYKDEIVRLKEKINQHDNEMAQVIGEYESEIERLKGLVRPENAIEADFGLQLDDDDDDDDDLMLLLDDDDDDSMNQEEEEHDEIKV